MNDNLLKIEAFLTHIGIGLHRRILSHDTFLPGLELDRTGILMDEGKLSYPGDILHEAGHLAVTPASQRHAIGTDQLVLPWPTEGEEIGAVLWSFAAARHIGLPLEVIFHPHGYKNDSEWLIEMFESGTYIGLHFLEWAGLALSAPRAAAAGVPAFPHMLRWLRE
jgi:hypothetical protein